MARLPVSRALLATAFLLATAPPARARVDAAAIEQAIGSVANRPFKDPADSLSTVVPGKAAEPVCRYYRIKVVADRTPGVEREIGMAAMLQDSEDTANLIRGFLKQWLSRTGMTDVAEEVQVDARKPVKEFALWLALPVAPDMVAEKLDELCRDKSGALAYGLAQCRFDVTSSEDSIIRKERAAKALLASGSRVSEDSSCRVFYDQDGRIKEEITRRLQVPLPASLPDK